MIAPLHLFSALKPTRKLYHLAPACDTTQATVIGRHGRFLVLDQTNLYPEGGGQVSDLGRIEGIDVVALKKTGGRPVKVSRVGLEPIWVSSDVVVVHELRDDPAAEIGDSVTVTVDPGHRRACSRNHSAAHFLFAALQNFLAEEKGEVLFTKGCHIGPDGFRFDIGHDVSGEELGAVAARMTALLAKERPIRMEPVEGCDDVFLWKCAELTIPCGGTHVATSREIGDFQLKRRSKGKHTTRIDGKLGPWPQADGTESHGRKGASNAPDGPG